VEAGSALSREVKLATLSEVRLYPKAGNSGESLYEDENKWPYRRVHQAGCRERHQSFR
jgi:hypothetical protein